MNFLVPVALLFTIFPHTGQGQVVGPNAPVVHADRSVTFRLEAPAAARVELMIQRPVSPTDIWGRQSMARDADGIWSLTTDPWAPELYGYAFAVDGVQMADPSNPDISIGPTEHYSLLVVPSEPPAVYEHQNAPYGTALTRRYWSKALQTEQTVLVHLPPGYEHALERRYPVLYLRGGNGGSLSDWYAIGRVGIILENLLARNQAVPMILVMASSNPAAVATTETATLPALQATHAELLNEIIPLIESDYRVVPDADHRALAGISLGGGQATFTLARSPGLFSWFGVFSAATPPVFLNSPALEKPSFKLLFFGCGTEDRAFPAVLATIEAIEQKGIHTEFFSTPGNHEWSVWRKSLAEFLPYLFRE